MARKKNPADGVVAFFESAPIEDARLILDVLRGVVARREGRTPTTRGRKGRNATPLLDTQDTTPKIQAQ